VSAAGDGDGGGADATTQDRSRWSSCLSLDATILVPTSRAISVLDSPLGFLASNHSRSSCRFSLLNRINL
jgi:hypothetical protein